MNILARTGLPWGLTLLVAASACARGEPPAEPLRPVRVMSVFASGGDRVRSFSGTTQAGVESSLSFKVTGTIQRIEVKVGDRVRAGDLLALLDPQDLELQVEDARASLELARAQARNARARLERTRELYESNNASRAEYDAALTESQSADAQVESNQKRLELTRLQLEYSRLKAPTAGAISEVRAEVNENVSPGQTVMVLTAGSRPEVEVAIPEIFIGRVREGQAVQVTLDALAGRSFPAAVTEVAVSATGAGTTFPVTVRFESNAAEVRPGMAAEVAFRFQEGDGRDRIVVPPFAVGEDRRGRFVFVAEPAGDGQALIHRRDVRVGELTPDGLEILDGLKDGELLVTAGISRIEDGLRVKLPGEGAPEA